MDFNSKLGKIHAHNLFQMDGYQVWGGAPVKDDDGYYYMFFSRWPQSLGHEAWISHSQICLAVSKNPLGPYSFHSVLLEGSENGLWDNGSIHNPTILKYKGRYYLYYMGNKPGIDPSDWWGYRNNQRIGLAIADHPTGPWQRFDQPLIDVSQGSFDHLMVSNPTVTIGPNDKIHMVYKGVGNGTMPKGGDVICCVATADHPQGPFIKYDQPIMVNPENGWSVEDPYIWFQDKQFYALVKDFQGYFTEMGKSTVALFQSKDGFDWQPAPHPFAFKRELHYDIGEVQILNALERPQLLIEDGQPIGLFCAAAVDDDRNETFNVHIPLI